MICIHCGNPKTSVTNSRPHKKRPSVWRRRACEQCGAVFTTQELVDVSDQLAVAHTDGSKTAFSIPVLMLNLSTVLQHRKTQADDAYWLAQTIAEQLFQSELAPLETSDIIQTAYQVLDRYDSAAAIQYGARYGVIATPQRRRSIRNR
jgi:transcriptional repressor NrdR